jgi:hypothetical protein
VINDVRKKKSWKIIKDKKMGHGGGVSVNIGEGKDNSNSHKL